MTRVNGSFQGEGFLTLPTETVRIDGSFLHSNFEVSQLKEALDHTILSKEQLKTIEEKMTRLEKNVPSEDLVPLYGRLETIRVNSQVDALFEEAQDLVLHKETYSPQALANKVSEVRSEVEEIWSNNGLELENRRYIRAIVLNLQKTEVFLSSKTADVLYHPHERILNCSDNEMHLPETTISSSSLIDPEWESADIAIDLCEIATLFHQGKIKAGIGRIKALTPSQKNRLEEHCLIIGAEIPNDCTVFPPNIDKLNQALIGFANEVAQGESIGFYPSIEEVREMLDEADSFAQP